jgi:hypothetical protein
MADNAGTQHAGSHSVEALTADRMKMWAGFTGATKGAIVFMVVLLTLMAIFLL